MRRTSLSPSLPRGRRRPGQSRSRARRSLPTTPSGHRRCRSRRSCRRWWWSWSPTTPGRGSRTRWRSVAAQTYRNTSLLVIDGASTVDLELRIAGRRPGRPPAAARRRRRLRPGGQRGAGRGRGSGLLPVLPRRHPARPRRDPGDGGGGLPLERRHRRRASSWPWDDPEQLLQVGMGADKTGAPAPYVDRGELDQEQHDAVRDVFYVPGAATLVRADLFSALGGFDPGIELLGEDLDLSWRAHVVGAPGAGGAGGARRPPRGARPTDVRSTTAAGSRCATGCARAGSATPHRAGSGSCPRRRRSPWSSWSTASSPGGSATPATSSTRGRGTCATGAAPVSSGAGWPTHRRGARPGRAAPAGARQRPLVGVRAGPDGAPARTAWARSPRPGRDMVTNLRSARARSSLIAWSAVLVVLLLGSRDLFTNGVPDDRRSSPPSPVTRRSSLQQWVSAASAAPASDRTPLLRPCSVCSAASATCSSVRWACCAPCSSSARSRSGRVGHLAPRPPARLPPGPHHRARRLRLPPPRHQRPGPGAGGTGWSCTASCPGSSTSSLGPRVWPRSATAR